MSEIDEKIKEHSDGCETRQHAQEMRTQLDDIHGLFFGDYNKPKNGLVMAIEKNTGFRKWVMGALVTSFCIACVYGVVRAIF